MKRLPQKKFSKSKPFAFWRKRLLLAVNLTLLLFFLAGVAGLLVQEMRNGLRIRIVTETGDDISVEKTAPTPEEDAGYIRQALELDEFGEDNIFQLEKTVETVETDVPAPIAENWEQAVAHIDAIELSAEEAYGLYEEKLPENIIDSPVRPNTHPKVNGIKIVVGRKPPYFGSKPVIAIVIDDMGISHRRTAKISSLRYPLTSSFLTYGTALQPQIQTAKEAGHEIMAHLPMEPLSSINVSPDVLTVKMDTKQVTAGLQAMLNKFSNIRGVNNHMGSRFTEDEMRMDAVMRELKRRGLFFLDSKTTAKSAAENAAAQNGVSYVWRNIFLDNEDKFDYIMRQLHQTETIARKNGYAVAIGHPKEQTYRALKVWLPTLQSRNLRLVPLSEIIKVLN